MTAATALFVAAVPVAPGFDTSGPPVRSTCVQQEDSVHRIDALGDGDRLRTFYDYRDSEAHTGLEREDTSQILLWDGPGGLSLVFLHDQPSGDTWGATGGDILQNISNVPEDARWAVQDDPGDFDRRSPPLYEWVWSAEHTDGGALRDVADHLEAGERIRIAPVQWYGISAWKAVDASTGAPDRIGLDMSQNVTVGPCETRLEADPVVADDDGTDADPSTVSATLTNNATGEPVPGAEVRFSAPTADGPRPLCRAETNATGVATCGLASSQSRTVASTGYTAAYRGTTLNAPATDDAPVVEAGDEAVPPSPADDAAPSRPDTRTLASEPGTDPTHPAFAEAGRTTVAGADWVAADLSAPVGPEPLVLATTQTENGGEDPSVAHVRAVGPDGFETQHCEHQLGDTCDGNHADEENGWIALRPAAVEDAPGMAAGTVSVGDDAHVQVTLPQPFDEAPLVFATVQTQNGAQSPRIANVSARSPTAFNLGLCEYDAFDDCDGGHANETVAWWAVEPGAPRGEVLDWGQLNVTNSTWRNVTFDQDFQGPPVVQATVQTANATEEVAVAEVRNVTAEGAQVRYCEEEGFDGCDDHPEEVVAWVAVAPGAVDYPGPSPPRNVTADPGPGLAQATVSWDPPRGDGGFDRTGYHVYRARADRNLTFAEADQVATVPPDATWVVDDAAPGRPFDYWVTAVNEAGWVSPPSHRDCTRTFPGLAALDGPLCPGPD